MAMGPGGVCMVKGACMARRACMQGVYIAESMHGGRGAACVAG